jgi:tyrosine-protein phosphatase OCA6
MSVRLIPPFRFAFVEKDLFRGAYPVTLNFNFLKTLRLKSIVSMCPAPIDPNLREFCESQGITDHYYEVPKYAGQIGVSASVITEVLRLMCRADHLPLYIHSIHGGHTNGLVIMCLRKLQMWSARAIFSEFNQYVTDSCEPFEEEFLNNYAATLELPLPRPAWLAHLRGRRSHPTMNVILTEEAETDSDNDGYNDDLSEGEQLADE